MPVFSSYSTEEYIFNSGAGNSLSFNRVFGDHSSPVVYDLASFDVTTITSNLPISELETVITSYSTEGFAADYFNRIHVNPSSVDLGNLLSSQVINFTIFNAFLSTETLNNTTISNLDGVNLVSPASTSYPPFDEKQFTLSVDSQGSAIIDGALVFDFSAQTIQLSVVGSRVVLWSFPHNWSKTIKDTTEYSTKVMTGRSGVEQRVGLRTIPRHRLSFSHLLEQDESALAENLLSAWQVNFFGIPVWSDKSYLSSNATAGDSVIDVNTRYFRFEEGGLAIIFNSYDNNEIVEIDSLTDSTITVDIPITRSWSQGIAVYPVVLAEITNPTTIRRKTDQLSEIDASFLLAVGNNEYKLFSDFTLPTYKTLSVINYQPDWGGDLDHTLSNNNIVIDNNVSKRVSKTRSLYSTLYKRFTWKLNTRQQIAEILAVFNDLEGKLKPIYIPSWNSDLRLVQGIGADDTTLTVKDNGLANYLADDTFKRDLMIRTKSGTQFYREVTGYGTSPNGVGVFIDSSLGTAFSIEEIDRVSYLQLFRSGSDVFELEWISDEFAEASLTMVGIR